ncbi:protein kinase family protein [Legionella gresilensis]|uniref:protein kinase family protein n=1 Tax=Legionella gresilensis TaxID=91823 RepID=UPI001041005E|nr:protein kinase family protein [Legionella gresilensis]
MPRIWEKQTKPGFFKRDRSVQYKRIDPFLSNVYKAKEEAVKAEYQNSEVNLKLVERLLQLEKEVLDILTNGIPAKKKKMPGRFYYLLNQITAALKRLSENNPKPDELNKINEELAKIFIDPFEEEGKRFKEIMVNLLSAQKDFAHNGYNLNYLGGNNNRNWLATNDLDGKIYVVRVEKADDPPTDYLLLEKAKENKEIAKFIAKDVYYYPTAPVEALHDRCFNLAISEYCPRGSIMDYRDSIDARDLSFISAEIVDITRQLATMALAFTQHDIAYMDIKAENFLIRDDGSVITADLKSIVSMEKGHVRRDLIVTTSCNSAPEQRLKCLELINAKQFMV